MLPPLPLGLPRIVPGGGDTVDGRYIPGGVSSASLKNQGFERSNIDHQTIVNTNPFAASMSSSNFKDPWTFSPSRWLGENTADILDAAQPFSMGTRACLGRSYVYYPW